MYSKTFKLIRAAKELSQQEFAKKIGVNSSLISRIESGERKPTERTIKLVANYFSVSEELIKVLSKDKIVFDGVVINKCGLELLKFILEDKL